MAKGNGERPAKKGTKDPLLEELKVAASKPNPPAEVPPRDTDKEDSGISAESIKREREEDALIDKNIEARRAAEAVATPEVSPPELEHLDEGERELYLKLPKVKQESYLAHIAEVRADKEKKEKKEKASKKKKPVKPRTQKPKTQVPEEVKEMTREELRQMATARAAALKPSGAAPDAPTIKMSVDAARSEADVHVYNPGQFVDVEIPEHGYQEHAVHVASEEKKGIAADKPNPDKDEEYPAVWRYNRDRPIIGGLEEKEVAKKEKMEVSLDSIKEIVAGQLRDKARIDLLDITETPEGLQLHAELDAGMMGGKIVLNGNIVNSGDTIAVEGLDVTARGYVKTMIENNLTGFAGAIKTYFERQHGKLVSNMHVGGPGLSVEFEAQAESPVSESELSPIPEGTPKEWREKLRVLIEGAKEKIGATSERGGQLVGYLAERGKALDAQGAELSEKYFGKLGEKYNKLPMWQKIALGGSLAMGLGLTSSWIAGAYGTALFATRFVAMAGSFKSNQKLLEAVNKGEATGRLANTRLYKWLGSGSSEKSRNNTAMAKALVTSFGMTAALGVAAKELSDYHVADRIGSYIGEHVYNWTHADVGAEAVGASVSESVPLPGVKVSAGTEAPLPPTAAATASGVHGFQAEVRHADFAAEQSPATGFQAEVRAIDNATVTEAPRMTGFQAEVRAVDNAIPESRTTGFQAEVRAVDNATPEPRTTGFQAEVRHIDEALKTAPVTPGTMPEMPTVGASAHGYEGMMKDLLKHLPDTRPENIPDGSDLAKLYEAKASADPEEVGRAIHRIAMEHKFFTDNTSFRVDVGAHMSADAHGNVLFNGEVQAPAGAHMIPEAPVVSSAYHPETPTAPVAGALPNVTAAEAAEGIVITETPTGPFKAAEPFISSAEAPVISAETPPTIPAEIPPAPIPEVQPLPAETVMTPDTTVTRVDAPEFVSEPHVETPPVNAAEAVATQAPAPVVEQSFISNQLGLRIPVAESHIYAGMGAEDLFVYGGSPVERSQLILEYLTKNPDRVIFAPSDDGKSRLAWRLLEGKLNFSPVRTSGFLGFLKSFMEAPQPNELAKLIK